MFVVVEIGVGGGDELSRRNDAGSAAVDARGARVGGVWSMRSLHGVFGPACMLLSESLLAL